MHARRASRSLWRISPSNDRPAVTPPPGRERPIPPGRLAELLAQVLSLPADETDQAWALSLQPGSVIGRYEVVRVAGRGGLADVCEARDRADGHTVALKLFRPGPRLRELVASESLRAEADAAARLDHPNVVAFFDAGQWAGGPFVVSEWLEGITLQERMRARPLPVPEVLHLAREISAALEAAHGAGVMHRDLEPGNVMLLPDGRVKVTGFGLARPTGSTLAGGGAPPFMSPEQWRGEPSDARSDVFSLGVILFQGLTGAIPYAVAGSHTEALDRGPTPRVTGGGIPRRLAELVRRCIERDPKRRFRDGAAVSRALSALDAGPIERLRSPRTVLAGVAVVLALAAGGAWLALRPGGTGSRVPVVVVDEVDATGSGAFAGVSDLLVRALEPSTRVSVLPRGDLRAAVKGGAAARLDLAALAPAWEDLKARWALVLTLRKLSVGYVGELAAVDPRTGDRAFTVAERAADLATAVDMIDRLARRARIELGERAGDVEGRGSSLAETYTPDLEAWRWFRAGSECMAGPRAPERPCDDAFRQAAAKDPGFGAAHLALAVLSLEGGANLDAQRDALEPALAALPRLPRRSEELVTAWKAALDGDEGPALATYRRLADADPSDRTPQLLAADLLWQRGKLADAVGWLDRILANDAVDPAGLVRMARVLGHLGERGRLEALATRLASGPRTANALHALSIARGWLGDPQGAAAAAEVARAAGSPYAAADAVRARTYSSELDAAEKVARDALAAAAPAQRSARQVLLAGVLAQAGRWRETTQVLDAAVADPGASDPAWLREMRGRLLVGRRDPALIRKELQQLQAISPARARPLAITLAYLGDLAGAAPMALELQQGSTAARLHRAVAAWRGGDPAGGVSGLKDVVREGRQDGGLPSEAGPFLLGSALVDAGDHGAAVDALRGFQRLYEDGGWRPWAFPRSRLLLASELNALGRRVEASEELGRLLGSLQRADEDDGLLRAARIVQVQMQGGAAR